MSSLKNRAKEVETQLNSFKKIDRSSEQISSGAFKMRDSDSQSNLATTPETRAAERKCKQKISRENPGISDREMITRRDFNECVHRAMGSSGSRAPGVGGQPGGGPPRNQCHLSAVQINDIMESLRKLQAADRKNKDVEKATIKCGHDARNDCYRKCK